MGWQNGTPLAGAQINPPTDGNWQVDQWNSVSMNVLTSGNGILLIAFFNSFSANPVYQERYTIGQGINGFLVLSNVYGSVMTITTQGTLSVTNMVVYGSNRVIPKDTIVPDKPMLNNGITQVFAAGSRITIQSVVTCGGMGSFNFRASPGLITGTSIASSWGFEYFDSVAQALSFQVMTNNKGFTIDSVGNYAWSGEFVLPAGVISFQVSNDGATTVNTTAVMTGTLPR